jgi:type 1 fimbria pilin
MNPQQRQLDGSLLTNIAFIFTKPRILVASVWVALVLMVLAVLPAHAQMTTATLNGTVTDPTGAVVPDATVNVTNVDTGVSRTTVTNQAGEYAMPAIDLQGRLRHLATERTCIASRTDCNVECRPEGRHGK